MGSCLVFIIGMGRKGREKKLLLFAVRYFRKIRHPKDR